MKPAKLIITLVFLYSTFFSQSYDLKKMELIDGGGLTAPDYRIYTPEQVGG